MHNLLITGGSQTDRMRHALTLAQKHLCVEDNAPCGLCSSCERVASNIHPNVLVVEPLVEGDGRAPVLSTASIKIDQIRKVVVENHKTSFEKGIGIFIITHMHALTNAASNALLKVMEESKHDKLFLALAPSRTSVAKTISSRLMNHLVKPSPSELELDDEVRTKIERINAHPASLRFFCCGQFSTERDELLQELDVMSKTVHVMLRKNLLSPMFVYKLSTALESAKSNVQRNFNPRLVVETLVLREWPVQKI